MSLLLLAWLNVFKWLCCICMKKGEEVLTRQVSQLQHTLLQFYNVG